MPDIETLDSVTAGNVAIDYMSDYGRYVTATKFPNLIDGLKMVHRIILYVLGTSTTNDKVNAIVGSVMARHPHGDQAVEDALVRLGQPFSSSIPLVCVQGNFGSYSGETPANGRYLDVQSSEFARDVYFNGINPKTLTYVMSQNPNKGLEPAFFIPKIPMALLTGSFAIGVGYSMFNPPLNFIDLCELTKEFIRRRSLLRRPHEDIEHYCHYLIPDYFTSGIIRNRKALLEQYKSGNLAAPVLVDGIFVVSPNHLSLRALPYGEAIDDLFSKLRLSMRDKDSLASQWFSELPNDRSTARTVNENGEVTMDNQDADMSFPLRRGVSPFAILEQIKSQLHFTRMLRPMIMGLNAAGDRVDADQLQVLELWYDARHRSMMSSLCYTQTDLIEELMRLNALLIINGHGEEVTHIFHNASNLAEVVKILVKQFKLSMTQAEYLSHLRLAQLTKVGRDELVKQREETKKKLMTLKQKFATIDQQMIDEVEALEKKYRDQTPRKSRFADYAGYVQAADGVIQFWDEAELAEIIDRWSLENLRIHLYPKGTRVYYAVTNNGVLEGQPIALPKDMLASLIVYAPSALTDTVILRDHKLLRLKGLFAQELHSEAPTERFTLVGDQYLSLNKAGKIEIAQTVGLPLRRNTTAAGSTTDVIQVENCPWQTAIVVHVNSKELNSVRLQHVQNGDRLLRSPVGTTEIVGVFSTKQRFIINVPEQVLNRNSIRHIDVQALSEALPLGQSARLILGSHKDEKSKWDLVKCRETGIYKLVF